MIKTTFLALALTVSLLVPLRAEPEKAPDYNKDVQVKVLLRTSTNSAGQAIVYPKGKPEVSTLIVTIAPGKQTGWHRHPVPLFGYVLSGQVTVQLASGEKHTFREGEAMAECVDMLHNGVNEGTEPTKLLIVVAGEKDVPFTKKATVDKDGRPLGDYNSEKEAKGTKLEEDKNKTTY